MSKIIDYKTLSASYPDELDVKVNEAIKEGWQPYGYQIFHSAFHQPMVKYVKRFTYTVRVEPDKLAKLLDIETEKLCEYAENGILCNDYPVHEWYRSSPHIDPVFIVPKPIYDELAEAYGNE